MLRRTLLGGAAVFALLWWGSSARPQDDKGYETKLQNQARSLPKIRERILAATGYDETSVELKPGPHLMVVTVVNSKLLSGGGAARVDEATVIASAVTQAIAADPAFADVNSLHVDYVRRDNEGKDTRKVHDIEFRKDPYGKFKHHVS